MQVVMECPNALVLRSLYWGTYSSRLFAGRSMLMCFLGSLRCERAMWALDIGFHVQPFVNFHPEL